MRVTGGTLGGRRYTPPTQPGLRPLTDRLRESLFNILQHQLELEGAHVLDVYAGSGALAWEALSRGAARVVSVELNRKNLAFMQQTAQTFGVAERHTTLRQKAELYLQRAQDQFHLIFLDPPYKLGNKASLVHTALERELLLPGGLLAMHHPSQEHYGLLRGFREERKYGGASISFFTLGSEERAH